MEERRVHTMLHVIRGQTGQWQTIDQKLRRKKIEVDLQIPGKNCQPMILRCAEAFPRCTGCWLEGGPIREDCFIQPGIIFKNLLPMVWQYPVHHRLVRLELAVVKGSMVGADRFAIFVDYNGALDQRRNCRLLS